MSPWVPSPALYKLNKVAHVCNLALRSWRQEDQKFKVIPGCIVSFSEPRQCVSVRVSIAVMKHHDQKTSWKGKGLFGLWFLISSSLKEVRTGTLTGSCRAVGVGNRSEPLCHASSYRTGAAILLEAGAGTEAMEGCYLLACSS